MADIWRESDVWYQGRSRQQAETEYETCSNNEWREVSRGHSKLMVANIGEGLNFRRYKLMNVRGTIESVAQQHNAKRVGQGTGKQRAQICPLCR